MEVLVETRTSFTVLGILERGKDGPKFIPPLWGKFGERSEEIVELKKSGGAYGVMDHFDEATGEFDYLAGFEVEPDTEVPEGMTRWHIPEQMYASIKCTIPTIFQAYDFFSKEWVRKEGYQRAHGPEFEYYLEEYHYDDENDPMYLYVPTEKAAE